MSQRRNRTVVGVVITFLVMALLAGYAAVMVVSIPLGLLGGTKSCLSSGTIVTAVSTPGATPAATQLPQETSIELSSSTFAVELSRTWSDTPTLKSKPVFHGLRLLRCTTVRRACVVSSRS